MVERQEVEALLAACERDYIGPHPDNDTLAALCRAWLAIQDAPAGIFYINNVREAFEADDWQAALRLDGKRVRIVPVEGGE